MDRKSGVRTDAPMHDIAAPLTDEHIDSLAIYFSRVPR